jgi:acyl-CoA synthetase (NDP forming)
LALAANQADRVVDGCWAGSLDDEASALVLMFEAEAEDVSAAEVNGHMLKVSVLVPASGRDTRFEQSAIGNLKSTQAQGVKGQVIPRHPTISGLTPLIHHQAASHNIVAEVRVLAGLVGLLPRSTHCLRG